MTNAWVWFKRGSLMLIGIGLLCYAGACTYANFIAGDGTVKLPSVDRAAYAVQIKSTGQVLLSDKVDVSGSTTGQRTVTMHGYYELINNRFVLRKGTLPLKEELFGQIKVTKREVAQ